MLANLNSNFSSETAQDTFNDWYSVKKSKKHKKRNKGKSAKANQTQSNENTNTMDTASPSTPDSTRLEALVETGDYVIKNKSKKKKKTHRRIDEDLSKSMNSLQTESPPKNFDMDSMLNGVLDYSKAIKKEKHRKEKNELKKKSKKSRKRKNSN